MSGILGIFYTDDQPVYEAQLTAMGQAIVHRGPDGYRQWLKGSVGFGHQMLWTTPESLHETLPDWEEATQLAITADVRLDNREELIHQLELRSNPSAPLPDSQILLAAYRKWGSVCPEHLLGDFAFAIWDQRSRTLFCARDHFGVKPFYFYFQDRTFAFASEIKALLELDAVPAEINEVKVADYLTATINEQRITIYQNIWRMPAAHTLTVQTGETPQEHQYWQLDPNREVLHQSDEDYAREYRHHFLEAVHCRMRSAYPVGAHLSGGLDSSSVACSASYLSRQENLGAVHTFSHIYPDVPESDESEFIEAVLAHDQFIHHSIRGDTLGALTEWKGLFGVIDEALIGNSYFNWIVNRSAQQNGVRVLMSGYDGDTVVGHGLNYLTEAAQALQWQTVIQETTAFVERYNRPEATVERLVQTHTMPMLKTLARSRRWLRFAQAVGQLSPTVKVSRKRLWYECGFLEMDGVRQLRQWTQRRQQHSTLDQTPFPFLNPAFRARLDEQYSYTQRQQKVEPTLPPPQSERESQWRTLSSGLMAVPLEIVDPMSAVHGVETRHPFLDKRLVEYCLAIPASQKLSQGWTRMIMRRGMAGILPTEVQWRGGKGSPRAVFFYGLNTYDRPLLEEIVDKDFERIRDYLNVEHAREQYSAVMKRQPGDLTTLWLAITLALWSRKHSS